MYRRVNIPGYRMVNACVADYLPFRNELQFGGTTCSTKLHLKKI